MTQCVFPMLWRKLYAYQIVKNLFPVAATDGKY
jgi:hypothetical protein